MGGHAVPEPGERHGIEGIRAGIGSLARLFYRDEEERRDRNDRSFRPTSSSCKLAHASLVCSRLLAILHCHWHRRSDADELDLRWHRRRERDRHLQVSVLARERPPTAQRILDVIEILRRSTGAHARSKFGNGRAATIL